MTGNYIYANGEKVAYIKNDSLSIRYYLHDHLGSVMATVSPSGSMCDRYQYLPWGKLHLSQVSANTVSRFMYTGQELDEELDYDLYYYGSRYYDPELKIFTQIDPRRHDYPDWGPYVYTLNNPMKYVDPDGEVVETALDIISIALSAKDMYDDPSWENAGWLGLDVAAAFVPVIPAAGIVRHGKKIDDVVDAIKGVEKATDAGAGTKKTYQTYTKTNKKTGQVYSGRTSGTLSPKENVTVRDRYHHLTAAIWIY